MTGPARRRVVVFGPPGAGKTTYVAGHAPPGALRWDYDAVHAALAGLPGKSRAPELMGLLEAMRQALLDWVCANPGIPEVWVIVMREAKARQLAHLLGAELVEILPDHRAVIREPGQLKDLVLRVYPSPGHRLPRVAK